MGPGGSKRSTRDEPETGGVREGHLSAGDARVNMIGGGPRLAPFGAAVLRHGAGQVCREWRGGCRFRKMPKMRSAGQRPPIESHVDRDSFAVGAINAHVRDSHPLSKITPKGSSGFKIFSRFIKEEAPLARSRVAHPTPHPRRMDTFPFPPNGPCVLFPSATTCGVKSSGLDSQMTVPSH